MEMDANMAFPNRLAQRLAYIISDIFTRGENDGRIVSHNLQIFALFCCHHCLEVINSEQCVVYVLKYGAKNSKKYPVKGVFYQGGEVKENQQVQ
jgi:hypothetical protein